jgi:hypothetical protein
VGIGNRVHELARLLRAGHGRRVGRAIASRLSSRDIAFGLRRDLTVPLCPPAPKLQVVVRRLDPLDALPFLDADAPPALRESSPSIASGSGAFWTTGSAHAE